MLIQQAARTKTPLHLLYIDLGRGLPRGHVCDLPRRTRRVSLPGVFGVCSKPESGQAALDLGVGVGVVLGVHVLAAPSWVGLVGRPRVFSRKLDLSRSRRARGTSSERARRRHDTTPMPTQPTYSLTGLLRKEPLNLRSLYEERAKILADHSEGLPLPQAPKSFHELSGRLPQTTHGYAVAASQYHKFLAAVSTALGGQAPSDEVANAASAAFRALQAMPAAPTADDEAVASKRLPPGLSLKPPCTRARPVRVAAESTAVESTLILN